MKKYMIVYHYEDDGKTYAEFFDSEDFVDDEVEGIREDYATNPEVYIYTIYGYKLLYR